MKGGSAKAIIVGNVGQDPEIRYTENKVAVAEFSVATSEYWKDKTTGEEKSRTTWHTIKIWDKGAELAKKIIRAGAGIYIEASITTDKWKKEGEATERTKTVYVIDRNGKFILTDPAPKQEQSSEGAS